MKKYIFLCCAFLFFVVLSAETKAVLTQEQIDDIVNAKAKEVYDLINMNWTYPEDNDDLYTASEFWKPVVVTPYISLILCNPNCNIIEALRDLPTKPGRLECMVAVKLVKILCLLELMGEENFNKWIDKIPEITGRKKSDNLFFHVIPDRFFILKGNAGFYYIRNHNAYTKIKPNGIACGYNGYLFQDQQFISFDPNNFNETKHVEEVQRILFDDIMSDKNVAMFVLHHLLKAQYKNDDDGFYKFRSNCLDEAQQKQPIWQFGADKINAFIENDVIPENG